MPAGITREQARSFYDRFGRAQDLQWYEDRALDRLAQLGRFQDARAVFELGCGTGRLAVRLLELLPEDATWVGQDVSSTMVQLSRERLAEGDIDAVLAEAARRAAVRGSPDARPGGHGALDLLGVSSEVLVARGRHGDG